MSNLHDLAQRIKQKGRELGFDLVGITTADPSAYRDYFWNWLEAGHAGAMAYLSRRFDERTDPRIYFPPAQSVICLATNYHVPLAPADDDPPRGKIARYALGEDYHEVIKRRLHALADWLAAQCPEVQTRCGVDTAPIMEKELAARAGVGWMGKNTCIIHPQVGSWLLLGEVLTSLPLPPDAPAVDRCGTCTRCIDACPTGAIGPAYQLQATRCLSYQTIENPSGASDVADSDWLYGCDICQEVCPWNRKAPATHDPVWEPRLEHGSLALEQVIAWEPMDYQQALRKSAMKRVKLPMLQANARRLLTAQKRTAGATEQRPLSGKP